MIKGFEDYTHELTEYEQEWIIPILIDILSAAIGKEKAVTNKHIVETLRFVDLKSSGPRIRHMIHILRVSDRIVQLIATSDGYYITENPQELKDYQHSLDDRLRNIYQVRRAIKRQISNFQFMESGQLTFNNF